MGSFQLAKAAKQTNTNQLESERKENKNEKTAALADQLSFEREEKQK